MCGCGCALWLVMVLMGVLVVPCGSCCGGGIGVLVLFCCCVFVVLMGRVDVMALIVFCGFLVDSMSGVRLNIDEVLMCIRDSVFRHVVRRMLGLGFRVVLRRGC